MVLKSILPDRFCKFRLFGTDTGSCENELRLRVGSSYRPSSPEKSCMVLHGMVARHQPDHNGIVRDPQFRSHCLACCLIWTQCLAVKAIGNNYAFLSAIA